MRSLLTWAVACCVGQSIGGRRWLWKRSRSVADGAWAVCDGYCSRRRGDSDCVVAVNNRRWDWAVRSVLGHNLRGVGWIDWSDWSNWSNRGSWIDVDPRGVHWV